MIRVGGLATLVVGAATAACGLLMLAGVGPSAAGADIDGRVPPPAPVLESRTGPTASTTSTTTSTTTASTTSTTTMSTTTTSSTSTSTTTTTSSTLPVQPPPIPLSVSPTSITVGAGGTARISGTCPTIDGTPLGPVVIWQIGSTSSTIETGVTAAQWSYDWTAPTTVEPLVLQVWCGDPSGYMGGYPEELQIEVVFVAQEAPPESTTTVVQSPEVVIPETD